MDTLHLFAGAGGGMLGDLLLGHKPRVAVEIEPYCRAVLAHRFPNLELHDDIRTFDATPYRGRIDCVAGGFPCQDISVANHKGQGISGPRSSLWAEMRRVVEQVRPRYVFVENAPVLRTRGLETVLRDLHRLGYDAAWTVLSAEDVGAPHLRKRMWILAELADADGDPLRHDEQRPPADGTTYKLAGKGSLETMAGRGTLQAYRIPTPTAGDSKASGSRCKPGSKAHPGLSLTDYVRGDRAQYPSPAARDWKSGKGRQANGHTPQLPEVAGGLLNPRWVEWLQAFPVGWLDLMDTPPAAGGSSS